jgi:CRISPR-associated protein Cas2
MTGETLPVTFMSGYRIMWMLVMFDLPVVEKRARDEATRFRKDLLDMGFEMAQFSVYMRCCVSKERTEALSGKIRGSLPSGGKVDILIFTDKQYENMQHYFARETLEPADNGQLALF